MIIILQSHLLVASHLIASLALLDGRGAVGAALGVLALEDLGPELIGHVGELALAVALLQLHARGGVALHVLIDQFLMFLGLNPEAKQQSC